MSTVQRDSPVAGVAVIPLVRRAAAALRAGDRQRLVVALNSAIRLLPALQGAWLQLDAGPEASAPAETFSSEAITLPLRGRVEVSGTLRQPVAGGIGAGHLRFLAAMAELVGAILEQTGRGASLSGPMAAFVLEQIPVGAILFSPDHRVLAANSRAVAVLGTALPEESLAGLWTGTAAEAGAPRVELVQVGTKTLVVHVHIGAAKDAEPFAAVALIVDLTARIAAFHQAVAHETYRALWTRQPLALAVFSHEKGFSRLVQVIDQVRPALSPRAVSGPLDGKHFAIAVPEMRSDALRRRLQADAALKSSSEVQVGLVDLAERDTPDALVSRALAAATPAAGLARDAFLVYDVSASVTESVQLALGQEADVVACHDRATGARLLSARAFDALFAGIEPEAAEADVAFVRSALAVQPRLAAFLITELPGPYDEELCGLPPETPVFQKPFAVRALREAVREAMLARRG